MLNYPKEQLWELYENLPKELQEAIFSSENADKIYDICTRNGVNKEDVISEIAKYTGYVLLGVLPPDELQQTLETELQLEGNIAKKIAWEISRFIFLPIKNSLEALYRIEITPGIKAEEGLTATPLPEEKLREKTRTTRTTRKKDTYREPVE